MLPRPIGQDGGVIELRRAAVLFDLDGVLVDSRAAIGGCLSQALAENGLPPRDADSLYRFIGPPLALAFAELTEQDPGSELVASCIRSYRARYARASLSQTTVVAGIQPVLVQLARRYLLAVATSKPVTFADPILAAVGLRHFFSVVCGPDLSSLREDKARTVSLALAGLDGGLAVMVGDRSFDVTAAHANGIAAIGVSWGIGSFEELLSARADLIIDHPDQLPAAVEGLLAESSPTP